MHIVTVTEKNRKWFENMIAEEFLEPLDKEGHFVLGAIGEDEKGKYAAGVLSFAVEEGNDGEEEVIVGVLKWLYVAKEFRNRGAADALMEEFFRLLAAAGVEAALCDVPMDASYLDLIWYLDGWGFVFQPVERYEVRIPLKRLQKIPGLWGKASSRVVPLQAVPEKLLQEGLEKAEELRFIAPDLEEQLKYCDRELSCMVLENRIPGERAAMERGQESRESKERAAKDQVPVGLTVICPVASDVLELVYMRTFSNEPKYMGEMIHFLTGRAKEKYGLETEIRIVCRSKTTAKVIDNLLPETQPLLVMRGVCPTTEEEEE